MKTLNNKNKIISKEKEIKDKENDMLISQNNLPEQFYKLNEIERVIFYYKCFITPLINKNSYTIENITISINEMKFFKNLYRSCYATYLEKQQELGKQPLNETFSKEELDILEYLNTLCTKTNWNTKRLIPLTKIFKCSVEDLKDQAIKYRYLTIYSEKTGITSNNFTKILPTSFQKHQLSAKTQEEIMKIDTPIQLKDYINRQKSNKYCWKNIENIEGLPPEEIIKMIYNIQTKSNIFNTIKEKKKKEKKDDYNFNEKQKYRKKIVQEMTPLINLFENQDYTVIAEFCRANNIDAVRFQTGLNALKRYNEELYYEFRQALEKNKESIEEPTEDMLIIIEKLKEQGEAFNILDYAQITDTSLKDMKQKLQHSNLSNEDKKILQTFISKNFHSKPLNVKQILSIIETKKDKDGNLVTISRDDCEEIINYIKNNKLPETFLTYSTITSAYINGEIDLNQKKNRKI